MTAKNLEWYFRRAIKDQIKKGTIKGICRDCWLEYYQKLNDYHMKGLKNAQ